MMMTAKTAAVAVASSEALRQHPPPPPPPTTTASLQLAFSKRNLLLLFALVLAGLNLLRSSRSTYRVFVGGSKNTITFTSSIVANESHHDDNNNSNNNITLEVTNIANIIQQGSSLGFTNKKSITNHSIVPNQSNNDRNNRYDSNNISTSANSTHSKIIKIPQQKQQDVSKDSSNDMLLFHHPDRLAVKYDNLTSPEPRNLSSSLPDIPPPVHQSSQEGQNLPPIEELTASSNYVCPPGLIRMNDTHLHPNITHTGRKIPKIVHMTAKSRCVSPKFYEHLQQWEFPDHSFYFHDDDAVDKLLYANHTGTQYEIVPNLTQVLSCVTAGATKSDLFRYLILWHYGGIYSDVDNSPTGFNGDTISSNDDSFFVHDKIGVMSQFFFASSPRHPLMIHSLRYGIQELQKIDNVMVNNPAKKTGPGALKNGFIQFQAAVGIKTTGYIPAGIYEGGAGDDPSNSSSSTSDRRRRRYVTVIGQKERPQQYVNRNGLSSSKKRLFYKSTGMSSYQGLYKKYPSHGRVSCLEHIRRQQVVINNGTSTKYKVANYVYVNGKYVDQS